MPREERYRNVIRRVADSRCTIQQLNELKDYFRLSIDSARRFGRITTLITLLKILEKRDIFNPDDISQLRYVATKLGRNDLLQLMDRYNEIPNDPVEQVEPVRVLPNVNPDPIERIHDVIIFGIGKNWPDFARNLGIPEGHIDQLQDRHRHMSDAVREILERHKRQCHVNFWKINLFRALDKARRQDLRMQVEDAFANNELI